MSEASGERAGAGGGSERPRAVETLDLALADWLSAFTVPGELAAEMADACAAGAAWAAAVAAVAAREAGWDDAHAMAWGIAVGAQAGALEAARRSLDPAGAKSADPDPGPPEARRATDGPAATLLASDALVAAAHEALSSLPPERLARALAAFERRFADGGAWRAFATPGAEPPSWRAALPLALAIADGAEPGERTAAILHAARKQG